MEDKFDLGLITSSSLNQIVFEIKDPLNHLNHVSSIPEVEAHRVDFTSELTPAIKCRMGSEMKAIFSPTKVWLDACAQSCALSNNLPSRKTVFALVMANDTVIVTPSNIYANGPFIFLRKVL